MSPFGAVRMTRGVLSPVANCSTVKPGGAFGTSASVQASWCDMFAVERVAYGAGKSAGVIRRRTPGASVRQSPNAAAPVRTASSANAGAAPANPRRTRNPSRIHPTFVTINPLRNAPRWLQFLPQYPLPVQSHRIHRWPDREPIGWLATDSVAKLPRRAKVDRIASRVGAKASQDGGNANGQHEQNCGSAEAGRRFGRRARRGRRGCDERRPDF